MRTEKTDSTLGRAAITPDAPVAAGSHGLWRIEYTVGTHPMTPGACIRFTFPYGFTPPQVSYRTSLDYLRDAQTGHPFPGLRMVVSQH